MYQIDTDIRFVTGVGPAKAKALKRLGIHTALDLLDYSPNHYIFGDLTSIADVPKEGHVIVKGTVKSIHRLPIRTPIVEAVIEDKSGRCKARWYNQTWALSTLRPSMTVWLWGKMKSGTLQQPRWSTIEPDWDDIQGGFYGTHNKTIRAALREVLSNIDLPTTNVTKREAVYWSFHFPQNKDEQEWAEQQLKMDELLQFMWAMNQVRHRQARKKGVVIPGSDQTGQYMPFEPTDEQCQAMDEISVDLASGRLMNRLLHGEVGSGKTLVAFYAAMLTALAGKRALILCPTTILAQQHFDTLKGMRWMNTTLYLQKGIIAPTCSGIIIGTHAILNNDELLRSASLVVIDEQHRFGVEQRQKACKYDPHFLMVSGTPIPRTLSMTIFGDLDVSIIKEQPTKRGQMIVRWVLPDKEEGANEILGRELATGHQVFWIHPRIGDQETEDSAIQGLEKVRQRFPDYKSELITGRSKDKNEILQRFRDGEIDILVGTVIVECGIDCPNANVAVITGADRFGLAQLWQMMGRIRRSKDTAFCFLMATTANQTSIDRLSAIERIDNGFDLAEEDLRLRGPGDMFSTLQHGLPKLHHASLVDDYDLILEARKMVQDGNVGEGTKEFARMRYDLDLGEVK
jgi:ATP-dependent DNA helicase RecG